MAESPQVIADWLHALPGAEALAFWPPPATLYSVGRLYAGLAPDDPATWQRAWDTRVYRWTLGADGKPRRLGDAETVATRLHDAQMDRLVRDYVEPGVTVGVMGGHDVARTDPAYAQVAQIARSLRRRGMKVVTGGGPGLMEAANLGAFLAPHGDPELEATLALLQDAPDCGDGSGSAASKACKAAWICTAAQARARLLGSWDAEPLPGGDSLGIPTWYYGAEPPNLFASCSGKYFLNSLREDGLVSVAGGGLIFAKGAAGTVQEVFQNATYNYYRGEGVDATPMVFLGADFWNAAAGAGAGDPRSAPVYPLARKLAADARPPFAGSLLLTDDPAAVVDFLVRENERRRPAREAELRTSLPSALAPPRRR